jgi:hypothetical protein
MVFQPSYTGTRSDHDDDGDGRDKWEFEITTISKPLYVSNDPQSYVLPKLHRSVHYFMRQRHGLELRESWMTNEPVDLLMQS